MEVNSVCSFIFAHYKTLLQNATDITAYDSDFMTKCGNSLLQNMSSFLSQNVAALLKIATVTNYKVRMLLQNGSVHIS